MYRHLNLDNTWPDFELHELVNDGGWLRLAQLTDQSHAESGWFVAGPFAAGNLPTRWQRIRAVIDPLPPNVHVQLFTYTSAAESDAPSLSPPPSIRTATALIPGPGMWRAAPLDADEFLVLHEPARFLWIGGVFQGDGRGSPVLHQIRLDYENDGWLRYLPAIYARDRTGNAFLERALALFKSLLEGVEEKIDDLPRLFDPLAAPDQLPDSWLDWLAGWLAFELDEGWAEPDRREAVAGAFDLLARRGTVEGLRRFIARYAGVDAVIDEPTRFASIWSLGEMSILGFTTQLTAAEAQGAVLGTTATLDRSHLIGEVDYGAPLFDDLAHRFCVRVRAAEVRTTGTLARLQRVIEREKPAHTGYHLCLIEPGMRVGAQAQLGVDTIVAGPVPDMVFGQPLELGVDTALAAFQPEPGGMIGKDSRVGVSTRLA